MRRRFLWVLAVCAAMTPSSARAALTGLVAQVTDSAGAGRASFSSTERMTMSVRVQNTTVGTGNIQFSFEVRDPQGARRLFQTGNSAPASVTGFTGATLRGVPVSQFYNGPGTYTLVAKATLDGETAEGRVTFTVLSPVLTLTYPPNGARELIDQPLTFRWVSSGATRYRLFVDDDSSFYNALFTAETGGSFFAYPQNPPDARQRLAGGQTYYWRVEGVDGSGNVVARTDLPFSFTVKSQGAQATSKDLAVVNLEKVNEAVPGLQGALPVAVYVKNQGGRSETNVSVNLFADGAMVPASPKRLMQIEPGKTERLVFPVRPPEPGKVVLVNAFLDFFDDNLQNNTLSRLFRGEEREHRPRARAGEMWNVLRRWVTDPRVMAELEGYNLMEIEGEGLTQEEIAALLQAVRDNRAHVVSFQLKAAP